MSIYDHMPGGDAHRERNLRRIAELNEDTERTLRLALVAASDELRRLLASWEYAFACADECAIATTPEGRALLQRVDDLRATIKELTP